MGAEGQEGMGLERTPGECQESFGRGWESLPGMRKTI